MRTTDLFESEDDDRLARMQAGFLHSQIRYWLEAKANLLDVRLLKAEGQFDGGYILPVRWVNDAYDDLLILFTPAPSKAITGQYASAGGFFKSNGMGVIVIPCLMAPNNPQFLDTRFAVGSKKSFVHEFMHYLMSKRKPANVRGSARHVEAGDVGTYFNDPDEVNAYYQEAAHGVIEFMNTVVEKSPEQARRWLDMSTVELVTYVKQTWFDENFLKHANPKTIRAIDRRLARLAEMSIRPILNKIVGQAR